MTTAWSVADLPSDVGWMKASSRECTPMKPPSGFLRRTATRTFRDRHEAGRALADDLATYRGKDNVLVLGLARGGVPVAWEIASALRCGAGRVPGPQARRAALVRARDGRAGQRRRRRDERQRGVQPAHHRRAGARGDRQRDGRARAARAGISRRPASRRPERQDRDPGRRRHRHRRQHAGRRAGRYGPAGRSRSWSRSRWGRSRSARSSRRWPTTWCA